MIQIDKMGCHYQEVPGLKIHRPGGSDNYLLLLFLSDIYIQIQGERRHYEAGSCILYTPGYPQLYYQPFSGFDNDWIHFSGDQVVDFLNLIEIPVNTAFSVTKVNEAHTLFRKIEEESLRKESNYSVMTDLLMKETLLLLAREAARTFAQAPQDRELQERFRQARSTILSHMERNWSIEDMAELVELSVSRFSHLYQEIFHISPKKDLLTERMNMAGFLLQTQGYSVSDAAAKVGYENLYHFSKQFKATTGNSPSSYKKRFAVPGESH